MALLGNIFSLVEYHAGSILCHGKPLAKCLRRKSKQPDVFIDLGNWPFKNLPFYLVTFMGGIHL